MQRGEPNEQHVLHPLAKTPSGPAHPSPLTPHHLPLSRALGRSFDYIFTPHLLTPHPAPITLTPRPSFT